ncbi:MAG: hypothetical protein IJV45_07560 [Prevotella sp.]|nr:hypothetical protein [Prevotella sp.]
MNKVYFLVCCLLILTSGIVLTGCSSDDDASSSEQQMTTVIETVSSNEDTDSFFKEMKERYLKDFDIKKDTCYRIDSKEALKAIYRGTDELPEIDFRNYTLLLGNKFYNGPVPDYETCRQVLSEYPGGYIFNIYCSPIKLEGDLAIICAYNSYLLLWHLSKIGRQEYYG